MKILLFSTLLLTSFSSFSQSSADTLSVKKVVVDFQSDFNEGNFSRAEEYASEDWIHIAPNGAIGKGRDTLVKVLRSIHQSFLKGVTMSIVSMSVQFGSADMAIVDVVHQMSNYTTPDGIEHDNERQMKSYVVVRKNGRWLLMLDHNTIIQ